MTNAEGKIDEKDCWGQISAWCDYSGPIDGKVVGLAVLATRRTRYPTCWHSRDYGLMAANPFGRKQAAFPAVKGRTDLVRLAKGEHLRCIRRARSRRRRRDRQGRGALTSAS